MVGTANWGTEVCPLGAFQPLIRDSERVVNGMQPLPMAQVSECVADSNVCLATK
jgi:hypothetical protein